LKPISVSTRLRALSAFFHFLIVNFPPFSGHTEKLNVD
jgi:hypothetical protein